LARFLASPALGMARASERLAELERLAREDASPRVRREAIEGIGRAALAGSVAALERLVRATRGDEALASASALADLPAARERVVALVRDACAAPSTSTLESGALAELVRAYGRALADLPGGGVAARERAPFVLGRLSAAPAVAEAARGSLGRFIGRLMELADYERADAALAALAAEGLPACECLDLRARAALQAGDAARASRLALELERAAEALAPEDARGWLYLGIQLEGAALFACGDAANARARFLRAQEVLALLLEDRPDRLEPRTPRGSDADVRWRAGGALGAERRQLFALAKVWIALSFLAEGAEPTRPDVLELLRSAHEDTIRARVAAVSSDVRNDFPLDDLLRRDLAPTYLVLLNRRLAGRDEDASYRLLDALGRGLASVAPWEMPGFERVAPADEILGDPLADPARIGALAELRQELADHFGRQILRNQREAGLNQDVSLPVNQRLKAQQRAIEIAIQEEQTRLAEFRREAARRRRESSETMDASGGPVQRVLPELGADERRAVFQDLANYLTPSTRFALDLIENLMSDGRLAQAEALARRLLEDLGTRLPGVSDVESEHFLAGAERQLGSVLSQANRPTEAEAQYQSAVRRLEALENSLAGAPEALQVLRRERADVLVSLAVNSNVRLGDPARALGFFEQAYALDQRDFMLVLLACYRARSGRVEEAHAALRRVAVSPVHYYNLACTHALLGERDLALDYLARDLAENQVTPGAAEARRSWARGDPDLASLRDEARFRRMMGEGPP
jgi:tetratricopeptide (TPR) repeat protein